MKKKQNLFILTLIVMLVSINTASHIVFLANNYSCGALIYTVAACMEHLFVIYYVLYGYRKPHGNLLRYTMLLFGLTIGINLVLFGKGCSMLNFALPVAELLLIPYIAGRLNKVEQNKVLVPFVLILFIIDAVSFCLSFEWQSVIFYCSAFGQAIEWFAISAAYFVRYREHKEAGLADAPKTK